MPSTVTPGMARSSTNLDRILFSGLQQAAVRTCPTAARSFLIEPTRLPLKPFRLPCSAQRLLPDPWSRRWHAHMASRQRVKRLCDHRPLSRLSDIRPCSLGHRHCTRPSLQHGERVPPDSWSRAAVVRPSTATLEGVTYALDWLWMAAWGATAAVTRVRPGAIASPSADRPDGSEARHWWW